MFSIVNNKTRNLIHIRAETEEKALKLFRLILLQPKLLLSPLTRTYLPTTATYGPFAAYSYGLQRPPCWRASYALGNSE